MSNSPEPIEATRAKNRARAAEWRAANPEKSKQNSRDWRSKNQKRSRELTKRWYLKNKERANSNAARWYVENTDRVKDSVSRWTKANKDKVRKYQRERFKALPSNSEERIKGVIRSRINLALAGVTKRTESTEKLLGCSIQALRLHIEAHFLPGMSWENRRLWHLDHEKPCRAFDLTYPDQRLACFHYTNLRPIWAKENLAKNDKVIVFGTFISARKIFARAA